MLEWLDPQSFFFLTQTAQVTKWPTHARSNDFRKKKTRSARKDVSGMCVELSGEEKETCCCAHMV